MANALAHSADPHARPLCLNSGQLFRAYPLTFILDPEANRLAISRKRNPRRFALRVSVDIRQAFLHDAKDRQLQVAREPSKIFRSIELYLQITAFC